MSRIHHLISRHADVHTYLLMSSWLGLLPMRAESTLQIALMVFTVSLSSNSWKSISDTYMYSGGRDEQWNVYTQCSEPLLKNCYKMLVMQSPRNCYSLTNEINLTKFILSICSALACLWMLWAISSKKWPHKERCISSEVSLHTDRSVRVCGGREVWVWVCREVSRGWVVVWVYVGGRCYKVVVEKKC